MTFLSELLHVVDEKEIVTIIDICCGDGSLLDKVVKSHDCPFITGIDNNQGNLKKASQKLKFDQRVEFALMDAKDLRSLRSGYFDIAFCCRSLHFLPEVSQILQQIHRILTPRGKFIMINFPIFSLHEPDESDPDGEFSLDNIFNAFYSSTFQHELNLYFSDSVRQNFSTYCHPDRTRKQLFGDSSEEYVTILSGIDCEEISLLDVSNLLRESTVVKHFIERHSETTYSKALNSFYRDVCDYLMIEPSSLYFEDIRVVKKQIYHAEIHSLLGTE